MPRITTTILNINPSDFRYQSQTKRLLQAQGIADAVKPHVAVMAGYLIFDADIEAIINSIATCNRLVIATRAAITDKKITTSAIKKLMVRINGSLMILKNLITAEYAHINPNLFIAYQNNCHIVGKGIRYTGLSASFINTATGKPIAQAVVAISVPNKTAMSNSKGLATIVRMTAGIYEVHCSASGYTLQVLNVKVSRERVVKLAVGMVTEEYLISWID